MPSCCRAAWMAETSGMARTPGRPVKSPGQPRAVKVQRTAPAEHPPATPGIVARHPPALGPMDLTPFDLPLTDPRHPFHLHHMEMALDEAAAAAAEDEVPVGAVVVSLTQGVL